MYNPGHQFIYTETVIIFYEADHLRLYSTTQLVQFSSFSSTAYVIMAMYTISNSSFAE